MEDFNQLMKVRFEKLNRLRELEINPYPYEYEQTHKSKEIKENFEQLEKQAVS
ncbi:MAG TPA: lysine--tRNA ligase, partial [Caldithrix sp.]|nr:lysine--tRNA ligase [Caldithrix sp.]